MRFYTQVKSRLKHSIIFSILNVGLNATLAPAATSAAVSSPGSWPCLPEFLGLKLGVTTMESRLQHVGPIASLAVSGRPISLATLPAKLPFSLSATALG